MRFITEFELEHPYTPTREKNYKSELLIGLGNMVGHSFDWKELSSLSKTKHTFEIEAFPMDKWIEFKNSLFSHMDDPAMGQISPVYILQLIKHLESFGKPEHEQSNLLK